MDPTTSNILLAVPTRGSDTGTWDLPLNSNSTAIDGYFGGVQTFTVSNTNITLTAPSGTVTASAGPTQAQNAVLKLTGNLTGSIIITLPVPGFYIVDNQTTGSLSNTITFRALGIGNVIAVDQGDCQHIYNDGTNVRFINLGRIGAVEIWGGYTSIPAWVTACTIPPYLYCNGSGYSTTTFNALFRRIGYAFGGSGPTFAVPDLRGRVPLPYDDFGRITSGGCGLAGNVIGATLDEQTITLTQGQLPVITPIAGFGNGNAAVTLQGDINHLSGSPSASALQGANSTSPTTLNVGVTGTVTVSPFGGGQAHPNVQPSAITGIAVIRSY